jgi:hypothetical protein
MTLDRTGEPRPDHDCRRGWLSGPNADEAIPCLICRPHLAVTSTANDFAERVPSARAQRAIESEKQ